MPSVDRNMLIVLAQRLRDIEDRYVPVDARADLGGTIEAVHTCSSRRAPAIPQAQDELFPRPPAGGRRW